MKDIWFSNFTKETSGLKSRYASFNTSQQLNLRSSYQTLFYSNSPYSSFDSFGFRCYSQHEEDGLIWYIFSLIGTTNKKCVEVCAGDGIECNTANLTINHGWIGLLFDGNAQNIKIAQSFYYNHPNTQYWPPTLKQAWITKNNINSLIKNENFTDEIDLLSMDIDGIDYWLWQTLNVISPRLVVLEFNHLWGPYESVTVPYSDNFKAEFTAHGSDYAGASLAAFVKLGKKKGYRLIGTNRIATNAFFLRNDIVHDWLPEVNAETCFKHPRAIYGMQERFPLIKDKNWVKV